MTAISNSYSGQRYRVMVDIHHFDGSTDAAIFGWANEIDHDWLARSHNGDLGWSNLRYEPVTDRVLEAEARSLAQRILALPLPFPEPIE